MKWSPLTSKLWNVTGYEFHELGKIHINCPWNDGPIVFVDPKIRCARETSYPHNKCDSEECKTKLECSWTKGIWYFGFQLVVFGLSADFFRISRYVLYVRRVTATPLHDSDRVELSLHCRFWRPIISSWPARIGCFLQSIARRLWLIALDTYEMYHPFTIAPTSIEHEIWEFDFLWMHIENCFSELRANSKKAHQQSLSVINNVFFEPESISPKKTASLTWKQIVALSGRNGGQVRIKILERGVFSFPALERHRYRGPSKKVMGWWKWVAG